MPTDKKQDNMTPGQNAAAVGIPVGVLGGLGAYMKHVEESAPELSRTIEPLAVQQQKIRNMQQGLRTPRLREQFMEAIQGAERAVESAKPLPSFEEIRAAMGAKQMALNEEIVNAVKKVNRRAWKEVPKWGIPLGLLGAGYGYLYGALGENNAMEKESSFAEQAYLEGLKLACLNSGLPEDALFKLASVFFSKKNTDATKTAAPINPEAFNAARKAFMQSDMALKWLPYVGGGAALGAGTGYATADEGQGLQGAIKGGLTGAGAGAGLRLGAGKALKRKAHYDATAKAMASTAPKAVDGAAQTFGARKLDRVTEAVGNTAKDYKGVNSNAKGLSAWKGVGGAAAGGLGAGALGSYLFPGDQSTQSTQADPYAQMDPYLMQQAQMMGYMPY